MESIPYLGTNGFVPAPAGKSNFSLIWIFIIAGVIVAGVYFYFENKRKEREEEERLRIDKSKNEEEPPSYFMPAFPV